MPAALDRKKAKAVAEEPPLPALFTCRACWGTGVRYRGRFRNRVIYVCDVCHGQKNFYCRID